MTDNEKLDLILEKLDGITGKVSNLESDLKEIKQKVNRLELGQSEMRRELLGLIVKLENQAHSGLCN